MAKHPTFTCDALHRPSVNAVGRRLVLRTPREWHIVVGRPAVRSAPTQCPRPPDRSGKSGSVLMSAAQRMTRPSANPNITTPPRTRRKTLSPRVISKADHQRIATPATTETAVPTAPWGWNASRARVAPRKMASGVLGIWTMANRPVTGFLKNRAKLECGVAASFRFADAVRAIRRRLPQWVGEGTHRRTSHRDRGQDKKPRLDPAFGTYRTVTTGSKWSTVGTGS